MEIEELKVFDINKYSSMLEKTDPIKYVGKVKRINALLVESDGPKSKIGEVCKIILSDGRQISAEVIGLEDETVKLMCYDEMEGIEIGDLVIASGEQLTVFVGEYLLGKVVDGIGKIYNDKGQMGAGNFYPIFNQPSDALKRKTITEPMVTGIKAIDGMMTIGKGQRIGIFAGSGVGKSTLLGMIAKNSKADVNVIALIGERGRELNEFIENELGEEGLKRSVIIFASSNKPALSRVRGCFVATSIAEYFRDQGKDVILMMDSVTRFAWAQREIGLTLNEAPASKGFTPSVLTMLPKLMERAGTSEKGSITGIYSVLVEGDDTDEIISDTIRGILDGHIVLSRKIAHKNHYPAIDILASISRLMIKVTDIEHRKKAGLIRELIAAYKEKEDLIDIGAYASGSDPKVDAAILVKDKIDSFLKQDIDEAFSLEETLSIMDNLLSVFYTDDNSESESSEDLVFE